AAAWTITNFGIVVGNQNSPFSCGIFLTNGGYVSNASAGVISGAYKGVEIAGTVGSVVNRGVIQGTGASGDAVELVSGGLVDNLANAQITATRRGVFLAGGVNTVVNFGSILATGASGFAISAASPAVAAVYNLSGGLISGYGGILLSGAVGTINNSSM